jgi:hypothetical protein
VFYKNEFNFLDNRDRVAVLRDRCLGIREETKFYNGGDSGSDDCDN